MTNKMQVFIAEDEELIRRSLVTVIQSEPDLNVIGVADNGLDALRFIPMHQPDLVLMDIQMPGINGIECIKQLRAGGYHGYILVLTAYPDEQYVLEGLANGANGYLMKTPNFKSMMQTIRVAMSGQYILPAEVTAKLVRLNGQDRDSASRVNGLAAVMSSHSLTQREKEIIPMLLDRLSNKEIADALYVSEGTVKNYLTVIYEKLGVKNRGEAVKYLKHQLE